MISNSHAESGRERAYPAHGIANDVLGASWFPLAPSYSIRSQSCVGPFFTLLAYGFGMIHLNKICSDVIRTTTAPQPAPHCAHRELVAAASSRSLSGASKCAGTWFRAPAPFWSASCPELTRLDA